MNVVTKKFICSLPVQIVFCMKKCVLLKKITLKIVLNMTGMHKMALLLVMAKFWKRDQEWWVQTGIELLATNVWLFL